MISTYQTRVTGFRGMDRGEGEAALTAYAELYSRVQRKLFADVAAGRPAISLKSVYLKRYRIPARMFNGGAGVPGGQGGVGPGGSEIAPGYPAPPHIPGGGSDIRCREAGPLAAGPSEASPVGQLARPSGISGIGHSRG